MKLNSIKFKISVLYTFILGLILLVYSSILYSSLHYALYKDLDDELKRKTHELTKTITLYADKLGQTEENFIFAVKRAVLLDYAFKGVRKINNIEEIWFKVIEKLNINEDFITCSDDKDLLLVRSKKLSEEFTSILLKLKHGSEFKNIKFKKKRIRLINHKISFKNKYYTIQIASSIKPIIEILNNRQFFILISIPIVLLFTSFIGRFFASRILRPVIDITKTAEEITHEDLNRRVEAEHMDEEMKYLTDAFNDMIFRLSKSFKYIMEFSSNVAHELKTPLAIMIGEAELALRKDKTNEEYKRVLSINLEESQRLLKTVDDLLLLTKLDFRPEIFNFEKLNLQVFLNEIFEQTKILADQKDLKVNKENFKTDEEIYVYADKLHLRRLFFNLIDNAIKFNREKGIIDISLEIENNNVRVSIKDTGSGISDSDQDKVFNRFFHKDSKYSPKQYGNGLGLSIALSIAKVHKGQIIVSSQFGKGSIFTTLLPIMS